MVNKTSLSEKKESIIMRRGSTNWIMWIFFVLVTGTFACNQSNSTENQQGTSYVDSLLLEAVESTKKESFEIAFQKLNKVIEESRNSGDIRVEILGNINLGNLYLYYNSEEKALNYFFTSLDLAKKHKVDELLNTIYNNLGIVYSSNDDNEKAREYFTKALELSKKRKEDQKIAINLINLGNVADQINDLPAAYKYFTEASEISQSIPDTTNLYVIFNNLGNLQYKEKKYSEAKENYHKALTLLNTKPNYFYRPTFLLNYGKTLYHHERYDSSELYLKEALDSFIILKNTDRIIQSYQWLAKTYDKIGKKEKAIEFYANSSSWKDSLLNERNQKWISEMQMKYEFGKKEKEIEFIQHKAKQDKIIMTISIAALIIFSLLLFYSLKVKNTNLRQKNIILKKEQEVANLEMAKNKLEQEKLKQELELKNRELASKALHLVNKNEMLHSITGLLDQINVDHTTQNADLVRNAKRTIRQNINLDEQWEDFKIHFEEVHTNFFSQLIEDHPTLSQTDLRLCAYLLINLDSKEIAQISNISPGSVRKRKQRLREKLKLTKDQDIRVVLNKYEMV